MVANPLENIRFSAVESEGLGFKVWRGRLDSVDQEQLQEFLVNNSVDLAIINIPIEKKDYLLTIQEIGYPYILADILIYLSLDLDKYNLHTPPNTIGIEFIELMAGHAQILNQLIAEIFQGYQNHYTANPLLSCNLITAYQEWMQNFMSADNGRIGWLVKKSEKYVAFVTCKFSGNICEISLTGVSPNCRSKGVFSALIKHVLGYFKRQGMEQVRVSTQLHNYAAHRAYNKEGFRVEEALLTVHINSMLSAGKG